MKQRRLRLVSEQEESELGSIDDKKTIDTIEAVAGTGLGPDEAGEQNGVEVWNSPDKKGAYTGRYMGGSFSAYILDGGVLNPNDSKAAQGIIN